MTTPERSPAKKITTFLANLLNEKNRDTVTPPLELTSLTPNDMKALLPNLVAALNTQLRARYENEGLRPEFVLREWIAYIDFLNKSMPYKLELVPLQTFSVWDTIKVSSGIEFLDFLDSDEVESNLDSEQRAKLEEMLLTAEQLVELADFSTELNLVLEDEVIGYVISLLPLKEGVSEETLLTHVALLLKLQTQMMFGKLKTAGLEKVDLATSLLLFPIEQVCHDMLMQRFAELLAKKATSTDQQ